MNFWVYDYEDILEKNEKMDTKLLKQYLRG